MREFELKSSLCNTSLEQAVNNWKRRHHIEDNFNARTMLGTAGEWNFFGRTVRYFGPKTFISFDENKGWRLKDLSIFQQLFRRVFGGYKSTHLAHVREVLNEELKILKQHGDDGRLESEISDRINECWKKHYGPQLDELVPQPH